MTYDELPPRIQEYISSHYTTLKTLRLASRYRVADDKVGDLAQLLGDVFLQNIKLDQFPVALSEKLNIQKGTAFSLAAESAEQHFASFEDFLGPSQPLVQQWKTWAREFGGKRPADKASPEIERMISGAGQVRGPGMEFRGKTKKPVRPPQTTKAADASQARRQQRRPTKTVGQQIAQKRAQDRAKDAQAPGSGNNVGLSRDPPKVFVADQRALRGCATSSWPTG